MSKMSYYCFEKTLKKMQDCYKHLDDELNGIEKSKRNQFIILCHHIAQEYDED